MLWFLYKFYIDQLIIFRSFKLGCLFVNFFVNMIFVHKFIDKFKDNSKRHYLLYLSDQKWIAAVITAASRTTQNAAATSTPQAIIRSFACNPNATANWTWLRPSPTTRTGRPCRCSYVSCGAYSLIERRVVFESSTRWKPTIRQPTTPRPLSATTDPRSPAPFLCSCWSAFPCSSR